MDGLNDEAIKRARSDPAQLFSAAYQAHAATVAGYLRSRGVEDPEAVTHDVFLALYPQLPTLRGGADGLKTLLFTIAHARTVDYHRRRARDPMITEYDPELDTRVTASAEDHALVASADAGILSLLSTLVPEQREVLGLRIVADLSLEQTAAIMEKTPGAIKQLQHRALTNLRSRLAQNEEGSL